MTLLYVLFAILLFGILIAVHELGHFLAAKGCGVKVDEFSVGMGPALWKKQKGETMYALRILPIGGFCAMAGEDESSEDPRAFGNQVWWKRLIILVAGSVMNFIAGLLILLIVYSNAAAVRTAIISGFMEGSPYSCEEGLHVGDRFYSIDGHRVYQTADVADFLAKGDGVYDIVVVREGSKVKLKDFEFVPLEFPGYEEKMYGLYFGAEEATLPVKLRCVWENAMEFSRLVWMGLEQLLGGQVKVADMSGPVGIVDVMAETGAGSENVVDGLLNVMNIGAFIAINLAIMNMLPVPALDGGRVFVLLVTTLIELIMKRRVNPKYEAFIHTAGMVLLLMLMAVIMYSDVMKLIRR